MSFNQLRCKVRLELYQIMKVSVIFKAGKVFFSISFSEKLQLLEHVSRALQQTLEGNILKEPGKM